MNYLNEHVDNESKYHTDQDSVSAYLAKAALLQTKWLDISGEGKSSEILHRYYRITAVNSRWEKGYYFVGKYYYRIYEAQLSESPANRKPPFLNGDYIRQIVINYTRALIYGSKYVYETLPKVLQLWLDFAESTSTNTGGSKLKQNRDRNLKEIHTFY